MVAGDRYVWPRMDRCKVASIGRPRRVRAGGHCDQWSHHLVALAAGHFGLDCDSACRRWTIARGDSEALGREKCNVDEDEFESTR